MLKLQTIGTTVNAAPTYASKVNAKYSNNASHIITAPQRWDETLRALPSYTQRTVVQAFQQTEAEFKRRNPGLKSWNQLLLAESKIVNLIDVQVDATMQRELDMMWVLKIVSQFLATMVVPIQVYRDPNDSTKYIAWDGQHTLLALWVVAGILGEDASKIQIPVNIYQSSLKAQMRANFLSLNSSEGKKALEMIDHWMQQIYGVRIDGSKNPIWACTEQKQRYLEDNDLFATASKFGDTDQIGAISRLNEINKLSAESVKHLARYLGQTTKAGTSQVWDNNNVLQTVSGRPADDKEIVMIAHYFHRCAQNGIKVTDQHIDDLVSATATLFNSDFTPTGPFWSQVKTAYDNWYYNSQQVSLSGPQCKKEPLHGFPFLVAQMTKSLPGHRVPNNDSNSSFVPDPADLF
jgi:hypothetical protein